MAFDEDLSAFFNPLEFGETALLTPAAGGDGVPGNVIFDLDGLIVGEYEVQSDGPTALCPRSQWPTVREGDHLAIDFRAGRLFYRLRSVTPVKDGALVLLALAKTTGFDTSLGTLYLDGLAMLFESDYLGLSPGSAYTPGRIYLDSDALLAGAERLVLA